MPVLFRAMREDGNGNPEIGPNARCLGVRPGIDVPAKVGRNVVHPGQGGMSVSPDDPMKLPYFCRPPGFQGTGKDRSGCWIAINLGWTCPIGRTPLMQTTDLSNRRAR
jgi:hypothetical protein